MAVDERRFAMAIHGGAGARRDRDYHRQLAHLSQLIGLGRDRLAAGGAAMDVAVEIVGELETAGLYVAGRGAAPNTAGRYELDASVMDGSAGRGGAVAALQGFKSPIAAARAVMTETPHVLLAGEGAADFARGQGLAEIGDPAAWFTGLEAARGLAPPDGRRGTVGCVVLDGEGRLAAATSTGGTLGKLPGRVGDTPLLGAGTWADRNVAVSCTGTGEYFILAAVAVQVGLRVRLGGQDLPAAAKAALEEARRLGGLGGLIAVDSQGVVSTPFNTQGMARAVLHVDGRSAVEVF